jgi:hypothetical protein
MIPSADSLPLVVVTGLPRSGTSLVMALLAAGGHTIVTDNIRSPDADNPRGYYEYEPVKALKRESAWLHRHRGEAVKIISTLLPFVPYEIPLKVILIERDIGEILASQSAMLARAGKAPVANRSILESAFQKQIVAVREFLKNRPQTQSLILQHQEVIRDSAAAITKLHAFLPGLRNRDAMMQVVESGLYRQRSHAD